MIDLDFNVAGTDNLCHIIFKEKLHKEDFQKLATALHDYINEFDRAPNLLIEAHDFPFWDDFSAFKNHLTFVKNHHQLIQKVAILSDSKPLSLLPSIADKFTHARIRHFRISHKQYALDWLSAEKGHSGTVEILSGYPADVLAIKASGIISSANYKDMIEPALKEKTAQHDKLKLLYILDDEFKGATSSALWDDAKLSITYFNSFKKVALVTDIEWIRKATKFFSPLIPGEIELFDLEDLKEASSWIKS